MIGFSFHGVFDSDHGPRLSLKLDTVVKLVLIEAGQQVWRPCESESQVGVSDGVMRSALRTFTDSEFSSPAPLDRNRLVNILQ